ncbi:pyruvate kinase [Clostridium aminobutyricum]|uniref:Pyruvate kinase n=1 Tax=Clostridium aminobutyricum TaxID=33953 RepID=A0A939D8P2_CLOAM|nr:pyruvate kinase [Clostridium aminobutyricum]
MRKTKIVCTLGPSTMDDNILKALMLEGMNVARLNFSHGDHEQHAKSLERIRTMRESLGLPVASLLDTKGPEIRLCTFEQGKILLEKGQPFTLTTKEIIGNQHIAGITYKELPQDVSVGMKILIDDGLIELDILKINDTEIECVVVNGGPISDKKGVNVPNTKLSMPFISKRDYDDIVFGIEHQVDYIAASFVRTADDVKEIRKILAEHNDSKIRIIAKIENMQGVENIDEIIKASDGVMVARGDMGVEIPLEDVPILQKKIIKKCVAAGKIVITATQMLDSMMKNPRPTRAEATDVANAIYDGTSAIMLSGETAAGAYPVEALKTMVRIAERAEDDINYLNRFTQNTTSVHDDVTTAISHATCTTAVDLNAAAIITVTASGRTARMISKYRPDCPIIACTISETVWRQMGLNWGVIPIMLPTVDDLQNLFQLAAETVQKAGYIKDGDLTVITASLPLGVSGKTNILKVHIAGED